MASSSDSSCCCLCKLPFVTEIRKKKLINGPTTTEERSVILSLAASLSINTDSMLQDGYLCVHCQRKLLTIQRKQKELVTLVQQVSSYVLNLVGQANEIQLQGAGRRPSEDTQEPATKRPRKEPSNAQSPLTPSRCTTTRARRTRSGRGPEVKTVLKYPAGYTKTYKIKTPSRKDTIVSLSRRSYRAATCRMRDIQQTRVYYVASIAKAIKAEMKVMCSLKHDSILRSDNKQLKSFSWNILFDEMKRVMPVLTSLLQKLLPKGSVKLFSFIISVMLKKRCKHMSLVQRVVSMMLYGNATQKQVYRCLQPFMVCMSSTETTTILDEISDDYDSEVKCWRDKLKAVLKEDNQSCANPMSLDVDCSNHDDNCSEAAPIWEPFSDHDDTDDDDVWVDCGAVELEGDFQEEEEEVPLGQNSQRQNENAEIEQPVGETPVFLPPCFPPSMNVVSSSNSLTPTVISCSPPTMNVSSSSSPARLQPSVTPSMSLTNTVNPVNINGYIIVGDNIDKNVRPSFQRRDHQTESMHCFHSYAVASRIDLSQFSDTLPPATVSPESVLPNNSDLLQLYNDFEILVSRIIVQHLDEFKDQVSSINWHIESKYPKEMASKSKVVPLGIQFHNEARITEMCSILDELDTYIPAVPCTKTITIEGEEYEVDATKLHKVLLFGDQLTVARIRSAAVIRSTSDTGALDKLEGFVPAIADWHARAILLDVIWKRFYSSKSVSEKGSLYQLKVLINRTAVKSRPSKNVKPSEDFLLLILHCYIVAAAEQCQENSDTCQSLSKKIVNRFAKIHLQDDQRSTLTTKDMMFDYSTDLLAFCLLWHGFHDATREGDGDRILCYWKFLTVIFQQEGHYNYAKEGITLAIQSQVLPERIVNELKWSRTINVSGLKGHNIAADLHMEHLNKDLKNSIEHLGSNKLTKPIKRAAQSLGVVSSICRNFSEQSDVAINKPYHSYPSFMKDYEAIMKELRKVDIFTVIPRRTITSFEIGSPLLQNLKWKNISQWAKEKITNFDFLGIQ